MTLARAVTAFLVASQPLILHPGPGPRPVVLMAKAVQSVLPAAGGTVEVAGRVRNASECRLEEVASGVSIDFSHSEVRCKTTFRGSVTVGPNPASVPQTVVLALDASSGGRSYLGKFYITVLAHMATTAKASPASSVQTSEDNNWAGYAVAGGPFNSVTGSFNVPETVGAPATSTMDVWVGIDGFKDRNDLLQAGVMVSGSPCEGAARSVTAGAAGVYACPWTFVIQGGAMSEGLLPGISVKPGDLVTVALHKQSGGTWTLEMTNDSTGQSWRDSTSYGGPAGSAEWVVEDPGVPNQGCNVMVSGFMGQCPMPEFSPVNFSDVSVSPSEISGQYALFLDNQSGGVPAAPSRLQAGAMPPASFSVAPGSN